MSNWWANKLGTPQPQQQQQQQVFMPPVAPPTTAVAVNPTVYVTPQVAPQPQQAKCPECRGTNYGSFTDDYGNTGKPRCYDCGFPIRQSASGSGFGVGRGAGGGSAQPTKQVSTTNNYNPGQIIGKL